MAHGLEIYDSAGNTLVYTDGSLLREVSYLGTIYWNTASSLWVAWSGMTPNAGWVVGHYLPSAAILNQDIPASYASGVGVTIGSGGFTVLPTTGNGWTTRLYFMIGRY